MIVKDLIEEGLICQGIKDQVLRQKKVNQMIRLVDLRLSDLSRYPHEFSGGQKQRIVIARALIVTPTILIADEPISALDASIQAQIFNLLNDLKKQLGLTIIFISHDLEVVRYFCDSLAVMYQGNIVEQGTTEEIFSHTKHPYTQSLLNDSNFN
ncbi:ABC-type dipeptide/oligopeptide transport system, ATPase component [Candidatus Phytoplasma australiense]|uniref:ABC-type dipeptide/oligopeptide transport system, ATPase component n=1 Tax=Phytoplasma australiense TaxID=59748 RepID=B1VAS9_PHYAS|nr:ABC-type dipeptide/oligopeptide transport system, ATPase component [Candidatus Phytoplasma australiense]